VRPRAQRQEFCSKVAIVVEEADESQLWLELLPETDPTIATDVHKALLAEASELTAIFTATYRTAKSNLKKRKAERKKGPPSNRRAPIFHISTFPHFHISKFPHYPTICAIVSR